MLDELKDYLKGKVSFTDEQFKAISALYTPKKISKGAILLREGEVCQHTLFVIKGCLRSYVVDKNGKEHIIQFAPENWWISDRNSLVLQEPAMFYIDAIEDSEILVMDKDFDEKFSAVLPNAPQFLQVLLQNSRKAMQRRIVELLSASAEERYLSFIKSYPTIVLRVPQKMIASYLGITPESLSRIRKDVAHQ